MAGDLAGLASNTEGAPKDNGKKGEKGYGEAAEAHGPDGPYIGKLQKGDDSMCAGGGNVRK